MKCQKCTNAATLHITELIAESQIEELHLCEQCAQKYLYEPQTKVGAGKGAIAVFSPRLDEAGTSVKAQRVIEYVSKNLDYNLFTPGSVGLK